MGRIVQTYPVQDLLKLQQVRSWLQLAPLFSFIPPSTFSLSSGLASSVCPQLLFIFVLFFIHFNFCFNTSFLVLSGYRVSSLPLYISPCLLLGLCFALLYPSVCSCMYLFVCPSVRCGGGGGWGAWHDMYGGCMGPPHFLRG